jgi:molybdopterin-guanine dinucleotide biosynthesis protein MobB
MVNESTLPIFRFVGHSGTGKTTLLEYLIAELVRRGRRIAVAKDTHHRLDLDRPGKDSYRLAQAGAGQVLLTGPDQLALFARTPIRPRLQALARLVAPNANLLLAEGFRDDPEPAIVVWRAALGRPLPELVGPIVAIVSDDPVDIAVPRFDFGAVKALADFILDLAADSSAARRSAP